MITAQFNDISPSGASVFGIIAFEIIVIVQIITFTGDGHQSIHERVLSKAYASILYLACVCTARTRLPSLRLRSYLGPLPSRNNYSETRTEPYGTQLILMSSTTARKP